MLRSITLSGLGPYADTTRIDLDPKARTDIASPSASGKTTLCNAVPWVLWGVLADGARLDDALITDGRDEVAVTLELGSGARITRRKRRGRSSEREYVGKDGILTPKESEWPSTLGLLGRDPDLLRAIVCPMAWRAMLEQDPPKGQPRGSVLRTALSSILPHANLRAVVAELCPDLQERDSIAHDEAYNRRKEANSARDQAKGRVQALEAQTPAGPGTRIEQPTPEEAQHARAVLDAAERLRAWVEHDRWAQAIEALGERPPADARVADRREKLEKAEARFSDLQSEIARLEQAVIVDPTERDEAMRTRTAAENRVRQLEVHAGACPTCKRDWPEAAAQLEAAREEAATAARAHDLAHAAFEKSQKAARDQRRKELDTVRGNRDAAKLAMVKARSAYEVAARQDVQSAWDAKRTALGDAPGAPEGQRPEPVTDEQVAAARAVQDRLREASGARREAEAVRARLERDLAEARAGLERWTAEAARLDRLVEAIRRAPSVVAERQMQVFGHLGPVAIRFPVDGPAIEVLIDGRPYWTASRGRLVVADLALRTALRRARGLGWLPIFVDNAQDWSGELATTGPAIVLRTAAASAGAVEAA